MAADAGAPSLAPGAIDPLLLDLPQHIDTPRLHLRAPRAGDGGLLFEAVAETLPDLRRFLASVPWVAAAPSVMASELYCRQSQANWLQRKDLPFLMLHRDSGELVGATGLHRIDWQVPKAEVGYWVRSRYGRQGLVAEAVQAVRGYAFTQLQARRLELVADRDNLPSRRVAERCGFTLEGTLRDDRRAPDGSLRSTCLYASWPDA